jgi:Protein of unknown function (DUF1176)
MIWFGQAERETGMGLFIRQVLKAAGAIVVACLPATAVVASEPGQIHVHADWAVGCDNALNCRALSLAPIKAVVEPEMWMIVNRAGAHDSQLLVTIWVESALHSRFGRQAEPMYLALDGQRIGQMPRGPSDPVRLDTGVRLEDALEHVSRGQRLAMHAPDGQLLGTVSLRGLDAALAEINAKQGSNGASGGRQRMGTDPTDPERQHEQVITSAPESQKLRRRADDVLVERERARFACGLRLAEPEPAWTRRLDDSTTLMVVPDPCVTQTRDVRARILLLGDDGSVRPAQFDHPPDPAAADILTNATWDDISRRLITRWTGRSVGDCGARSSYAWDGLRFRLEERREMPVCRGARQFIQTWKAEVIDR